MIFDTHTHISKKSFYTKIDDTKTILPAYQILECTYKTLIKNMLSNGVSKACIFPFPFEETKLGLANDYIVEAYRQNMELFIPFFLISDTINDEIIRHYDIRGFKEHFCLGRYKEQSYFNRHYDYLQQNELILIIHPHMTERITKIKYLKQNFPDLKIILAHSGRKWPFTGDEVLELIAPELMKYDKLFFDTSTIRNSNVIEALVNKYGSERILFGSDYPYHDVENENIYQKELETVLNAHISDSNKQALLGGNFCRLLMNNDPYIVMRCMREDKEQLLNLIENIPSQEKTFLAIDKKMDSIRLDIRNQDHIYLIKNNTSIVGFLRESGRPNKSAMVEEVYVDQRARGKGLAKKMINILRAKFDSLEAKTFSDNVNIVALFKSFGGIIEKKSPKGNIFYWKIKS